MDARACVLLFVASSLLSLANVVVCDDNQRIVGGADAQLGSANYQASLRDGAGAHFCGGAVVDCRWILTAAHCLAIAPVYITVGSVQLLSGVRYDVLKTVTHFAWDQTTLKNDIALVKTTSNIAFGQYVQPIALPWSPVQDNTVMTATGWGWTSYPGVVPDNMKMLSTMSISDQECRQAWPTMDIDASQMCVYSGANSGLCRGDSGSPVVSGGVVYGIVSFTKPCALGTPDVLTRVSSHRFWIEWIKFFVLF